MRAIPSEATATGSVSLRPLSLVPWPDHGLECGLSALDRGLCADRPFGRDRALDRRCARVPDPDRADRARGSSPVDEKFYLDYGFVGDSVTVYAGLAW